MLLRLSDHWSGNGGLPGIDAVQVVVRSAIATFGTSELAHPADQFVVLDQQSPAFP
jgi:hypothetical protein